MRLATFFLTLAALLFASASAGGKPHVVAAQGITQVQGEAVVVEILYLADGDGDGKAQAHAALHRLYPEVRDLTSADFKTTGLLHDVFFDGIAGNDQVAVNYNSAGEAASLAGQGFDRLLAGMNTWTDVPTSKFAFAFGTYTSRSPSLVKESPGPQTFDGFNDIGWVDIRETGVLGVTWYTTTRDEFDMAFDNKDFNWNADGSGTGFDIQTVMLHELGHALGLDHSDVQGSVMEPYYEGTRRVLHQDDVDGVTYLYPADGVDLPPSVTITSPKNGDVFSPASPITFTGSASDPEDGSLTTSMIWTAMGNVLGTGGSFSASLPMGEYQAIASATDSAGHTANASVLFSVKQVSATVTILKGSYSALKDVLTVEAVTSVAANLASLRLEVLGKQGQTFAASMTWNARRALWEYKGPLGFSPASIKVTELSTGASASASFP